MIVIQQMWKARGSLNPALPPILQTIVLQTLHFEHIEFFHVYRQPNARVHSLANKGSTLEQGTLELDKKLKINLLLP